MQTFSRLRGTTSFSAVSRFARSHRVILICVAILLLLVTPSICADIYANTAQGRAEQAQREVEKQVAFDRDMDRRFTEVDLAGVRAWFRDPDSVQFTNVRHFKRAGKTITCGFANGRNGFGGMAGAEPFAVVDSITHLSSAGSAAQKIVNDACW